MGYENMFEEVPIVIRNSHLINVLLWELEDKSTVADKHELLNLSSGLVTNIHRMSHTIHDQNKI